MRAARSLGAVDRRILRTHLPPSVMRPVRVLIALLVPECIVAEAGRSFLGLGVQPPTPSRGIMIADGVDAIESYPRLVAAPAPVLAAPRC